jgi:branched-chain amino acid aminotransferase
MARHKSFIIENGVMLSPEEVWAWNRAMRLGDGFFETVRAKGGHAMFWEAHYSRILSCAKALQFDVPPHFTSAFFERCIGELCYTTGLLESARIRFTFFREGEGTYRPDSNRLCFLLEATPLYESNYITRTEGATIDVFTNLRKHKDSLSAFKLLGNHVYIQAAIWAKRHLYNDALITNTDGHIIEGTASNLFIVKNGALHTPPLSDGCLGGVMRMNVLNKALELGIPCYESQLGLAELLSADEMFLTNSIKGISWVRSFREKRYFHKVSDLLLQAMNEVAEKYLMEKPKPVDSI